MFRPRIAGVLLLIAMAAQSPAAEPRAAKTDAQGDPLPPGAVARLGTLRWRCGNGNLTQIDVSPDGKLVAALDGANVFRVFDFPTGRVVRAFHLSENSDGRLTVFRFTSDSKKVLIGGQARAPVQIVDLTSGRCHALLHGHGTCCGISADGRWALVSTIRNDRAGRLSAVDLRNPARSVLIAEGPQFQAPEMFGCGLSPDGRFAAVALASERGDETGRIVVLELGTGQRWMSPALVERPTGFAFAPDGNSFVAGGEATMQRWELTSATGSQRKWAFRLTAKPAFPFEIPVMIQDCCFTPDCKHLYTTTGFGSIVAWDAKSLNVLRSWAVGDGSGGRVAVTPDGKTLLSASQSESMIRLWDTASGREHFPRSGHRSALQMLSFDGTGKSLASLCQNGGVRMWDLNTRQVPIGRGTESETRYRCRETAFYESAFDGFSWIAYATGSKELFGEMYDGSVLRWDNNARRPAQVVPSSGHGSQFSAVSRDGKWIALGAPEGGLQIVELATGKKQVGGWRADYRVSELAFLPDGRTLIAVNESNRLDYWDAATGRALRPGGVLKHQQGHTRRYWAGFEMSPYDGNRCLRVWELTTGRLVRRFEQINGVAALSPDGRYLAYSNNGDGDGLIEMASGERVRRAWSSPQLEATAVEFSPDGKLLAVGYLDGTILLWDTAPPRPEDGEPVDAKRVKEGWDELAGDDAEAAFAAIGLLVSAPKETLTLLRKRLKPVAPANAGRIAALIAQLDDTRFPRREAATRALLEMAEQAEGALDSALSAKEVSPEKAMRIERVLESVRQNPATGERLRGLRAVEVLERIGNPDAVALLKKLLGGSDAALARAAADALERSRIAKK